MSYRFLDEEMVRDIHADQLRNSGGLGGILSEDLLLSALAVPQASFEGVDFYKGLGAKAAAYLYHIVDDHPFFDGNKRTGLVAALEFLRLNDFVIIASDDELIELAVGVASGRVSKDETVRFFEERIKPYAHDDKKEAE